MTGSGLRKATSKMLRGMQSDKTSKIGKSFHGRVRRACDDCRGRKIRCDGKAPCLRCVHTHRECTFKREKGSRYKGPMYIEELEEQNALLRGESQKLKCILSDLFPQLSMEDKGNIEALRTRVLDEKITNPSPATSSFEEKSTPTKSIREVAVASSNNQSLEIMVEATEKVFIDSQGHCQYHGDFAGLAFLHQIGERCSQLLCSNSASPQRIFHLPFRQAFASENISSPSTRLDSRYLCPLPPKATAQRLTKSAFEDASCLLNFIHVPHFAQFLDRVYSTDPRDFTRAGETFLPLLYVAMAVGELFSGDSQKEGAPVTRFEQMKGINYFRTGKALLDAADCRDIMSLQAIVCVIIYLQASMSIQACHSYLSIAVSASLQMGLHRSSASTHLDPVQQETRKRLFWVIQTMETYVTTLLGLPTTLSDEDIDQEIPLCVDNEYLTRPSSPLATSRMSAVNAHIRLIRIMRDLVHEIYPRARRPESKSGEPYRVEYSRIIKFEEELDLWFRSIPAPTVTDSLQPDLLRTQLLLRLAYAHVQMVLYRPFIHTIIRAESKDVPEMRSFACASACIKAAMQIIWIVSELSNHGLLVSAYWFTDYITFFAVMVLCMFIIGNPDDPTVEETIMAAEKGRNILSGLAHESLLAGKCLASLGCLFDQIDLLCTERRRSRNSATSKNADKQPGPHIVTAIRTDPEIQLLVPTSHTTRLGDPTCNSWFDLSFEPSLPNLDLRTNDLTCGFEDRTSTQHFESSLLPMMGSPLHQLPISTPALATPVYGDLAPLEGIEFFPSFVTIPEEQLLETGILLQAPVY